MDATKGGSQRAKRDRRLLKKKLFESANEGHPTGESLVLGHDDRPFDLEMRARAPRCSARVPERSDRN